MKKSNIKKNKNVQDMKTKEYSLTFLLFLCNQRDTILVYDGSCILTYPAMILYCCSNVILGCAMIKNIQKQITPQNYEALIYAAVLLPLIGIVVASIIRAAVF